MESPSKLLLTLDLVCRLPDPNLTTSIPPILSIAAVSAVLTDDVLF